MYRYFGDMAAYDLFNNIAIVVTLLSSLFYFKCKQNAMGLYSKYAIFYASRRNSVFGKIVEIILTALELFLLTLVTVVSVLFNYSFGEFVGTGLNYFGGMFSVPLLVAMLSFVIMANPLKQMDIAAMFLPVRLFFLKLACFFNGCCWGIEWEYGLYNHHYDHPGYQVPVQAIEAFWALAIFVFLLIYRKKAKPGTLLPMYMILYSTTRFCSEFLRREENVFLIFKTYHLLCLAGIVIGILLLFVVKRFGGKIDEFFDDKQARFELKTAEYDAGKDERTRKANAKAKQKEREKKNKKLYAKSRKL